MSDSLIPKVGKCLVKMGASWCQPCKVMTQRLANTDLSIPVIEIDIDENMELARDNNVRGVPTMIVFNDGVEVARKVGLLSSSELQQLISTTE